MTDDGCLMEFEGSLIIEKSILKINTVSHHFGHGTSRESRYNELMIENCIMEVVQSLDDAVAEPKHIKNTEDKLSTNAESDKRGMSWLVLQGGLNETFEQSSSGGYQVPPHIMAKNVSCWGPAFLYVVFQVWKIRFFKMKMPPQVVQVFSGTEKKFQSLHAICLFKVFFDFDTANHHHGKSPTKGFI